MIVRIPLRNDLTFWDLVVPLDGVNYTLEFHWNARVSRWFLKIFDETGENLLLAGVCCVVRWPLGLYFSGPAPAGKLIFTDTSGQDIDPGLTDFDVRVKLNYMPIGDLQSLLSG